MEIFAKQQQEVDVLQDVLCDKCGLSCYQESGYEYALLMANWGYCSKKDGERHRAQLCEDCYDKILQQMGIKPLINEGGW
jgi:hypothetical protein